MLQTNSGRRRGRPFGAPPVFLADCTLRLDALSCLSNTRGARLFSPEVSTDVRGYWTLRWSEDGHPRQRLVELRVTASRQHLGGVRCWWRCPMCGRRCRVLLAVAPDGPLACRLCQGARYGSSYPGRTRRRRALAVIRAFGEGGVGVEDPELDLLLAPRRRGVRRGRRILVRAARALGRLRRRCDALPGIFDGGL